MNFVYEKDKLTPLTPQELADAANAASIFKPFVADMFVGPDSRIEGAGHCNCSGNGEFELLPLSECKGEQKRYMRCRICGACSHL